MSRAVALPLIDSGGFCDEPGSAGTADTGTTFTCGSKRADAADRFRLNAYSTSVG